MKELELTTDVLVIGGGIAGVFAAIKAKDRGVDVTIVDKGAIGKSGLTPWFGAYQVFDRNTVGDYGKQYIDEVSKTGEYLVNQDYIRMFIEDSNDIYDELVSWGAAETAQAGDRGIIFRKEVKKRGVRLIERTMITELLVRDGRNCGAVGLSLADDRAVVIHSKAVVLCSGSGALKTPGFFMGAMTHDGDAMAYRIGAEISGKEFIDFHWTHWENPADAWSNWKRHWGFFHKRVYDPNNGHMGAPPIAHAQRVHAGDLPVLMDKWPPPGMAKEGGPPPGPAPGVRSADLPIVGGATAGMAPHKCEGILPVDVDCSSSIPGLFAAGDALCTAGACYSGGIGSSASGSAVQGARAGLNAADYAVKTEHNGLSQSALDGHVNSLFEPLQREKGYSPAWVTQVMQGVMVPYFVLYVKSKERLEAALTSITFMRDQFASQLKAKDSHELRLVHETRNMLLNSEMKLRASLFRTESRGAHFREDFPDKDDSNWMAWVVISRDGENMKLTKRPVPDEWRPSSQFNL